MSSPDEAAPLAAPSAGPEAASEASGVPAPVEKLTLLEPATEAPRLEPVPLPEPAVSTSASAEMAGAGNQDADAGSTQPVPTSPPGETKIPIKKMMDVNDIFNDILVHSIKAINAMVDFGTSSTSRATASTFMVFCGTLLAVAKIFHNKMSALHFRNFVAICVLFISPLRNRLLEYVIFPFIDFVNIPQDGAFTQVFEYLLIFYLNNYIIRYFQGSAYKKKEDEEEDVSYFPTYSVGIFLMFSVSIFIILGYVQKSMVSKERAKTSLFLATSGCLTLYTIDQYFIANDKDNRVYGVMLRLMAMFFGGFIWASHFGNAFSGSAPLPFWVKSMAKGAAGSALSKMQPVPGLAKYISGPLLFGFIVFAIGAYNLYKYSKPEAAVGAAAGTAAGTAVSTAVSTAVPNEAPTEATSNDKSYTELGYSDDEWKYIKPDKKIDILEIGIHKPGKIPDDWKVPLYLQLGYSHDEWYEIRKEKQTDILERGIHKPGRGIPDDWKDVSKTALLELRE